MANFRKSLIEGKKSESYVSDLLTQRGWTVTDVTLDQEYWKKDIDLIIEREGEKRTVEIKCDNNINRTGNIFVETMTNIARGTLGWFKITEAEYLAIHDSKTDEVYTLRMRDLIEYLNTYPTKRIYVNDTYKKIEAYLVPMEAYKEKYVVQSL